MGTAVRVEHPCVGQHFVRERDDARSLNDSVAVAVDDLEDRAADAAGNASLIEREVLRSVERAWAVGTSRHRAALYRRQNLRHPTVRRIDEQTGLRERTS